MTIMEAIALIVTALVVPYVVQLIKQQALSGNAARWVAIGVSLLAGICAGFVAGVPETVAGWVTCIFAAIGGVQVAYAAYKSVGITSRWLDALANLTPPAATQVEDPLYVAQQQSLKDQAEDAADHE